MARVRSKNTGPEMLVRRTIHAMGYRFRLHDRTLPGTPDLVFASRRKVILVHGCFWHGHSCKLGDRHPKTRPEFWRAKIARNVERDAEAAADLRALGWTALAVWECELRDIGDLRGRVEAFLDGSASEPDGA